MKYPEDLTFTTFDLATPIDIKETEEYKNFKRNLWAAYYRRENKVVLYLSALSKIDREALKQIELEGFNVIVDDSVMFQPVVTIRWQNMKHSEDLTFTAQFLKDNPITVRDTTLYKDVKKAIWNNHSQGLRQYRCVATWYEFKENELDVLEALRAKGFDVIINNASNVALI